MFTQVQTKTTQQPTMSKQTTKRDSSAKKEILDGETFNPLTDIGYSKPKVNQAGGKSVGILNSSTNGVTYISTPLMLTWGISEFTDKKTGSVSYTMSLQFPGEEYRTPATMKFFENMQKFETRIKNDALANQKEWFGKTSMSMEAINVLWNPMLHYAKGADGEPDMKKNPTLSLKVPIWEGEWKVELYDVNGRTLFPDPTNPQLLPTDIIPKGTNVAVVMQCGGIWFANGKFGVTWKLFQAVVKPKPTLKGKCHIKLSADEKEKVSSQEVCDDSDNCDVTVTQDTDDEEEVSQPVTVKSEPKPVVKVEAPVAVAPAAAAASEPAPVKKTVVKRIVKKDV